ncbi:MAG: hypothetical protein Q8M07_00305 [Prosthecobacter sp.]|nr:hypothetical protein [Prosthecobacter sp.]
MSARDLLLQAKALPPAERRSFMEAMADLNMDPPTILARLRAPDFDTYWGRLRSLGMPAWTAEQTAGLDRWLAGEEDAALFKARDLAVLEGLSVPDLA